MVRDQSLLSGFNNPLRSCSIGRPGRVTAVPADRFLTRKWERGTRNKWADAGADVPRSDFPVPRYLRIVSQKYFGASSGLPFTTNPITRMAIQIP